MEFVKATKIRKRMCIECRVNNCRTCPMSGASREKRTDCDYFIMNYPREAEKIIEQWDKEHPLKTYKDVFMGKFPNAKLNDCGNPKCCAKDLFGVQCRVSASSSATAACTECWNQPYKEE